MKWGKEGVNYWENPDCPTKYLQEALVRLVNKVEGAKLPIDYFKNVDRDYLIQEVSFYESVADK